MGGKGATPNVFVTNRIHQYKSWFQKMLPTPNRIFVFPFNQNLVLKCDVNFLIEILFFDGEFKS